MITTILSSIFWPFHRNFSRFVWISVKKVTLFDSLLVTKINLSQEVHNGLT